MLNFIELRITIHYFVLVLIGFTGVLQVAAARYRLKRFSFVPAGRPWVGAAFGWAMIVGAFAWFIATTPEMQRTGPAGLEISLLFGSAVLLAVLVSRLVAALLRP